MALEGLQPQTPQPQATPQAVSTPKGISWPKIIITVVIILVVTSAIAGALWFLVLNKSSEPIDQSPIKVSTQSAKKATDSAKKATESAKKDETADWKTFTNDVHKYSIKIPPNWITLDAPSGGTGKPIWIIRENDLEKSKQSIEGLQLISIVVGSEGAISPPAGEGVPTTIDGENGLKYKSSKPNNYTITVLVNHKDKTYEILLSDPSSFSLESLFDQMLSTFTKTSIKVIKN